jgi:hypothetical protein
VKARRSSAGVKDRPAWPVGAGPADRRRGRVLPTASATGGVARRGTASASPSTSVARSPAGSAAWAGSAAASGVVDPLSSVLRAPQARSSGPASRRCWTPGTPTAAAPPPSLAASGAAMLPTRTSATARLGAVSRAHGHAGVAGPAAIGVGPAIGGGAGDASRRGRGRRGRAAASPQALHLRGRKSHGDERHVWRGGRAARTAMRTTTGTKSGQTEADGPRRSQRESRPGWPGITRKRRPPENSITAPSPYCVTDQGITT